MLRSRALKRGQKRADVDAVFAARILYGMERGDRAADTVHAKIEKNADGLRPLPHDVVDEGVELDRLDAFPHIKTLTLIAPASLRQRKQEYGYCLSGFL